MHYGTITILNYIPNEFIFIECKFDISILFPNFGDIQCLNFDKNYYCFNITVRIARIYNDQNDTPNATSYSHTFG
jgi:hypothetical protein